METKRYVGVIVKKNDKFLICKRNNPGLLPGYWSIPAGKIEENEEPQTGARREFFEETALSLNNEELKFVGLIPRYTRDGKKAKGLMYTYMIETDKPFIPDLDEAIDGEEHTECGYFTAEEIKNMRIDIFLMKLLEILSNKFDFSTI
jgi:8-oxo-dGTP pyrophosphatase MutT (NUDIX family)